MNGSILSVRNLKYILSGWWLSWAAVHYLALTSYGLNTYTALTDSLVSTILLAAACLLVINNMRYYLPGEERYWYVLAISAGLGLLWVGLTRFILWLIFLNNKVYSDMLSHSALIRFAIGFLMIACVSVLSLLWYSVKEQKRADERKNDIERMAREAELFNLRQQLHPHFLFNSLNSINALIGSRPEEARRMIHQLSSFLRGTLRKDEQQFVSLKDELEHLQLYLDIEKVRFGNRLSTVIDCSEEICKMKLPALLLQPIVENAIKFGLYDTTGQTEISIIASLENSQLILKVQNPFDPETSKPMKGTGFGLSSVERRLNLLFGRKDLLQTEANNHIFTTTVIIPQ